MEQVIVAGYGTNLNSGNTRYNFLASGFTWGDPEGERKQVVSTAGKIKHLRVKLSEAPGAGDSYDLTLMLNGAPSALTVHIHDTDTTGADTVNEIDVVAGDTVSVQSDPTGAPSSPSVWWTTVFESANAKESLILGGSENPLSSIQTEYSCISPSGNGQWSNGEANCYQLCPTNGKIKNLYIRLGLDPGTAPDAYRFTLRKNGISQTLTVTITADDTTGNDTANEVIVAAGDILTLMCEPLNGPAVSPYVNWGMTFKADIDGESVIWGSTPYDVPLPTAIEYIQLTGSAGNGVWAALELSKYQLAQVSIFRKLYVEIQNQPGVGKSYDFTVRINGGDGNLTVHIHDADTTGNSGALTDTISDDDDVDFESTPTGTPAGGDVYWGLVSYRAPPVVGIENKSANMGSKMVAAGLI